MEPESATIDLESLHLRATGLLDRIETLLGMNGSEETETTPNSEQPREIALATEKELEMVRRLNAELQEALKHIRQERDDALNVIRAENQSRGMHPRDRGYSSDQNEPW